MSQRAENNFRLDLYRELDDIVSAMKNLAQVELHRVSKAEAVQAGAWQTAMTALAQLQVQLPDVSNRQDAGSQQILILLGSERGFCGGFNEQVARALAENAGSNLQILVVGSRLVSKVPPQSITRAFTGPSTTDEVLICMQNLMEMLLQQSLPTQVQVLSHGAGGVQREQLLPMITTDPTSKPASGLHTYLPAAELRTALQWQVIQQGLLRLLLTSLKVENRHRLQQMEGAREHLEELSRDLVLRINALRQQEIVEEIEVILADQPAGL